MTVHALHRLVVAGDSGGLDSESVAPENQEINAMERFVASIFFLTLVVLMLFILVNFLFGIIGDVFSEEKDLAQEGEPILTELEKTVGPEFKRCLMEKIKRTTDEPSLSRLMRLLQRSRPDLFIDNSYEDLVRALEFGRSTKFLDEVEIQEAFDICSFISPKLPTLDPKGRTPNRPSEDLPKEFNGRCAARMCLAMFGEDHSREEVWKHKFFVDNASNPIFDVGEPETGRNWKTDLEGEVELQRKIYNAIQVTVSAVKNWQRAVCKWQVRTSKETNMMIATVHKLSAAIGMQAAPTKFVEPPPAAFKLLQRFRSDHVYPRVLNQKFSRMQDPLALRALVLPSLSKATRDTHIDSSGDETPSRHPNKQVRNMCGKLQQSTIGIDKQKLVPPIVEGPGAFPCLQIQLFQ